MIQKRIALATAAGLASALALAGCSGYGSNDKTLNTAAGQNTGADAGGYNGGGDYGTADNGTVDNGTADNGTAQDDTTAQDGTAAQDTTGQNSVQRAVGETTTGLKAIKKARIGRIVTDAKGWVVYRYDKDTAHPAKSNCSGACAKLWPPVLVEDAPDLSGIDADLVGSIVRADGGRQVTIANWPIYRYAKDAAPGKWSGNAVGGVWWAIQPSGKKAPYCRPGMSSSSSSSSSSGASSSGSASNSGSSSSGGGYSY